MGETERWIHDRTRNLDAYPGCYHSSNACSSSKRAPAAPQKTEGGQKPINCVAGKVCKGTSGDDVIIGSDRNDDINPFDGNDIVYAKGGNDTVRHSYGKDYIEGGPGADTVRGGFDDDTIYGNQPDARDIYGRAVEDAKDVSDRAHDLVDCAYLTTRGDTGGDDEGYGSEEAAPVASDTVVDCSNRDDQ